MPSVARELTDIIQVTDFPWCTFVSRRLGSCNQGFMVREYCKNPALQDMAKVSNSQVNGEEFPAESGVACFRGSEPLGEKGQWFPGVVDVLLKNRSDGLMRSVRGEHEWCFRLIMLDISYPSNGGLECAKRLARGIWKMEFPW